MRGDYYSDYGERPAAGRRSVVLRVLDWVLTPVTVAVGAAMLLTYFVPYVNPGRVWFLPVLGLAAPGVYVASVVLLLYWIIRWRWVQAGAMLLLVAAGLGKVSLFWRPEIRRSYEEKISERGTFGVMTYNVRGFYGEEGRSSVDEVVRLIREQNPDIVCLQEFNGRLAGASEAFRLLGEEYESARFGAEKDPDPSDDAGLAILSKYRILRSETVLTPHSSVWADVLIGDDTVRIFNDHLHSTAINADDNEYITTRRFLSDTSCGRRRWTASPHRSGPRARGASSAETSTIPPCRMSIGGWPPASKTPSAGAGRAIRTPTAVFSIRCVSTTCSIPTNSGPSPTACCRSSIRTIIPSSCG